MATAKKHLSYQIKSVDGHIEITMKGCLDEYSDLVQIARLRGAIYLNLNSVEAINDVGFLKLIVLLRSLNHRFSFSGYSHAVAERLLALPPILKGAL